MSTRTDNSIDAGGAAPGPLRVGARLRSTACETEVVVVKAAGPAGPILCGGHPMVEGDLDGRAGAVDPSHATGTLLGKRYGTEDLELLCVRAGEGSLSLGDQPLELVAAKHLPSSD